MIKMQIDNLKVFSSPPPPPNHKINPTKTNGMFPLSRPTRNFFVKGFGRTIVFLAYTLPTLTHFVGHLHKTHSP